MNNAEQEFRQAYCQNLIKLSEKHNVNPLNIAIGDCPSNIIKEHATFLDTISPKIVRKYCINRQQLFKIHDKLTQEIADSIDHVLMRGARLIIREMAGKE